MKLLPKLFLCCYPLKFGATIVGIVLSCQMVAWCIAAVIQVVMMKSCSSCKAYPWRNAYGLSITSCIYHFTVLAVNLWFLWGIKHEKPMVLVSWVAVTAIWLIQSGVLVTVLLCIYCAEAKLIVWLLCLMGAIVLYGSLVYGFLVGCSFWVELKNKTTSNQ